MLITTIGELIQEKRNVLVFQPGKQEIADTIATLEQLLKRENKKAVILPLHGELTPEEQKRIYKRYNEPVIIVATNIAQTSLTIPYIDAVVDSGKERRVEIKEGVETLVLGDISQADSLQRGGRAGRTKQGIYVLCNTTPFHQLATYPKPEIQRTLLDHNYLKILSTTGLKMEELTFFHQPPKELIEKAKNTLHILGAIDEQEQVTSLGKQLASLPVDVNTGRMIIESLKYGVTDDILKIAAIKQVGGIIAKNAKLSEQLLDEDSDLLTHLNLYHQGKLIQE
ncbi:MAG: hypothetical protein LBG52_04535 [Candidatus Peribacteria bacterium]|jgi:ATP-dependent helicase HrpA|nr:hypothetical protein [Candidatus Peribacteria bacterium]